MGGPGHVLVGSIGTSDYDTVTYELEGKSVDTEVSPAALVELINGHPDFEFEISAALIVRTEEAGAENDPRLERTFKDANIDYELVDIDFVESTVGINSILRTTSEQLRSDRFDEKSVVLDISHSFRTLPIVFLLSLMQLRALEEDLTLEKIYYSRFAGSRDRDRAPVIDLTYLRTMMDWFHAFESAHRTGTIREIQLLLEDKREALFRKHGDNHPDRREFADFAGSFGAAQREIDAGFPLEAGDSANSALDSLSKLDEDAFIGPEGMVIKPLEILIEEFETSQDISRKTDYELDEDELRREASIVRFYVRHGKYRIALECGRELFINRLLYDSGETGAWLEEIHGGASNPHPETSTRKPNTHHPTYSGFGTKSAMHETSTPMQDTKQTSDQAMTISRCGLRHCVTTSTTSTGWQMVRTKSESPAPVSGRA